MYQKTPNKEYNGLQALCSAIIMRACVDYLDYKREEWMIFLGSAATEGWKKHVAIELKRLRKFFLSDWFISLTDELDGQYLMEQLDIMFDEMARKNDFSRLEQLKQPQLD
jgi:hypothetical protein